MKNKEKSYWLIISEKLLKSKISEQHKEVLKTDNEIDKTAINKKIDEVVKLVISYILKGNDFKLLALSENVETWEKEIESIQKEELKKISMQVKQAVKSLPQEEINHKKPKADCESRTICQIVY